MSKEGHRASYVDRYEIDIFWSDEDDAYIAIVPSVERLRYVSAWGETREDALREIQEVLSVVDEMARESGNPLPEPIAPMA
jgi:predicted RNase H-like HicB family nuclease